MIYVRVALVSPSKDSIENRMETLVSRTNGLDVNYYGPHTLRREKVENTEQWVQPIAFNTDSESTVRTVLSTPVPDDIHQYIEEPRSSNETNLKDLESKSPALPDQGLPKKSDRSNPDEDAPEEPDQKNINRHNENSTTDQSYNSLSNQELNEMRERAVKEGNDSPNKVEKNRSSTDEYSRSSAVRDYVMARANGACEGCEEPAPFTSKTGEPYLHAHHIYELSDGGADTPDTVVALCPNCHYQVHHGRDGDEYNRELLKVVQKKENSEV